MTRIKIILIVITLFLILAFAVYNYLINIYEVIYKITPDVLYADGHSEITISVIPLNSLGWKALFREADTDYVITEGVDLVKITKYDKSKGIIKLKVGNQPGVVNITAKSSYALLPTPVSFQIYPNLVEAIH